MIYRIINKEKGFYKYIFTCRHIYCYIHALAETTIALKIAIKIIISYDNKMDVEIYKTHLSDHNNYDEIIMNMIIINVKDRYDIYKIIFL